MQIESTIPHAKQSLALGEEMSPNTKRSLYFRSDFAKIIANDVEGEF